MTLQVCNCCYKLSFLNLRVCCVEIIVIMCFLVTISFSFSLRFQTAYIDVCDDKEYSRRAKSFHQKAIMMQVPAITTAGIYPGVSNSGFLQSDTYSRISMSSCF